MTPTTTGWAYLSQMDTQYFWIGGVLAQNGLCEILHRRAPSHHAVLGFAPPKMLRPAGTQHATRKRDGSSLDNLLQAWVRPQSSELLV